jgi:hypothetical protein
VIFINQLIKNNLMNKSIFAIAIFILISLSSCHKGGTLNGGSWVFKSQTFHATFCGYVYGAVTGFTGTGDPSGSLAFYFHDTVPKPGTYLITNSGVPPDPGYVYIQLTDTSNVYNYVASSSAASTSVTVTVAQNGFVKIILPPVQLTNKTNISGPLYTDSSLVFGTIMQTL